MEANCPNNDESVRQKHFGESVEVISTLRRDTRPFQDNFGSTNAIKMTVSYERDQVSP
jgi:hypothetical protein